MSSNWFSAHSHSAFSVIDGIGNVNEMVAKAAKDLRPAFGLTDHGSMAGTVQLYKATQLYGMQAFPGVEAYLIDPRMTTWEKPTKGQKVGRYHITILANDLEGYQALVRFVSMTHTRPRFSRFPRCTIEDLARLGHDAGEHISVLTGCFFGLLQQSLVMEGDTAAERVLKMYSGLFPNLFVEVQNHNIVQQIQPDEAQNMIQDSAIVEWLVGAAHKYSLPLMATQDSHYLDQKHQAAHSTMKKCTYGSAEDAFPGDTYHVASAEWVQEHFDKKAWRRAEEGAGHLLDLNTLRIPALDTFRVHIPRLVSKPFTELSRIVRTTLAGMTVRNRSKYEERLDYELDVIRHTKMAGYFMLMHTCVQWCKQKGFAIESRGSANGSLVCFLMGITQVDPLVWGTSFDRFMSKDRKKPPDIDMDIEDVARERLLAYLRRTFDVLHIGTYSKLGVRDDGMGSIFRTYQSYLRRLAEAQAKENGDKDFRAIYARKYAWMKDVEDVRRFSRDDYKGLKELGTQLAIRSPSVHPSGILVSGSDADLDELIPRMLIASSNTEVSQYQQEDVEELGFLKMDWLGMATLTTMRLCQQYMGRSDPTDFTWIPNNDAATCRELRSGRMDTGIFHFEAYTKSKGGKELGIKNTMDVVIAQALYMPGATSSGEKNRYIARRRGQARIPKYIHPVFEQVLKRTYGCVVFQEQVLEIMQGLGMGVESFNTLLKMVKGSGTGSIERNTALYAALRKEFDERCAANGIIDSDAAWKQTAGFVQYGFNRAHATGYGIRSYRCAYLKTHYPLEFMAALLQTWAGRDKEKLYVREARRVGIRVLPADVNASDASWTLDRKHNAIRRGLVSIKGIGINAADDIARNRPYASIDELIEKCNGRTITGGRYYRENGRYMGNLLKLKDAGALRSITGSDT